MSVSRFPSWRDDAARIVEELFPQVASEHWDLLLDLRSGLRSGSDWEKTLDVFLLCRERMEADHYLPFFRLRRLLAGSLRLEAFAGRRTARVECLADLLRQKHRSLGDIARCVHRSCFEHALVHGNEPVSLIVTEKGSVL